MCEVLSQLRVGEFVVKVNHRRLLDGMFEVCGVPGDKFRAVSSSVDKLDKEPWTEVKRELLNDRALPEDVVEKIGNFVNFSGGVDSTELLLTNHPELAANPAAKEALDDLKRLFDYCKALGCSSNVVFDMSLARGLDYYTGPIFEAVLSGAPKDATNEDGAVSVGSIAGGGRYDTLVGMFDAKGHKVPCVGFSVGVERIFTILEAKLSAANVKARTTETQVLVASAQKGMVLERLKIVAELWKAGIKAEYPHKANPKMLDQIQYCEAKGIPLMVVVGEGELQRGVVKLRDVAERKEREVSRLEVVAELMSDLSRYSGGPLDAIFQNNCAV